MKHTSGFLRARGNALCLVEARQAKVGDFQDPAGVHHAVARRQAPVDFDGGRVQVLHPLAERKE